jgi:hypothetical protein
LTNKNLENFKKALGKTMVRNDLGKYVTATGMADSEADLRTRYPNAITEISKRIADLALSEAAVESLLNILARDLLPNSYLSKVRHIGKVKY